MEHEAKTRGRRHFHRGCRVGGARSPPTLTRGAYFLCQPVVASTVGHLPSSAFTSGIDDHRVEMIQAIRNVSWFGLRILCLTPFGMYTMSPAFISCGSPAR